MASQEVDQELKEQEQEEQVVRPNTDIASDITPKTMELVSAFVNFVEDVATEATQTALPPPQEAAGLAKSNKRAKISTSDIDVVNPPILPSWLAKHAVPKTVPKAAPTGIPRDRTTVLASPSTAPPVSNIRPPRVTVTIIPPPRVPVSGPMSSEGSNSGVRLPVPRIPDLNRSPPVSDSSSDEATAPD